MEYLVQMAEGLSVDLAGNVALEDSEQAEKSMSILPQGEIQTTKTNNVTKLSNDESSFEISGFTTIMPSGADYSSESGDPFNSVFYRVLPSENATHIHFYAAPLFNTILSVLEKEFNTPGEDINKFLLKHM